MPSEPFLGQIMPVGFNFAPRGWALCDGQLLPISQNTALFSLLGTIYGGDGRTNFALPDLRARIPIGQSQGPGLSHRFLGSMGGADAVTLNITQLPAHTHSVRGAAVAGTSSHPGNQTWAQVRGRLYSTSAPDRMTGGAVAVTGGGQPHNNLPPYLVVNFAIALQGIYPSRN